MTIPPGNDAMQTSRYIDAGTPAIVEVARRVTAGATADRERAVRLHDFVRDAVPFGFAPAFYDQTASEVLRAGVGYCNTKSTLFVALLRAAGIPARQHFVDIDARILDGVIDPRTAWVDHSFTEVQLDAGRWVRVDSYIVDLPLAERARARLRREDRLLGYGVHRHGVSEWDGATDAFSQWVDDGAVPRLTTVDHGVFDDVGAFYASGRGRNALGPVVRLVFGIFSRCANRRLDALRSGTD